MPEVPPLGSIVAVGINDAGHFGEGWHERTRDGRAPIPYRACGRAGALRIRRVPAAGRIHFLLSAPVGVAGAPIRGQVEIAGRRHPLVLAVDAWVLRSFELPPGGAGTLEIRLECDRPVVPDQFLRNGDARELGWYVTAVWQD